MTIDDWCGDCFSFCKPVAKVCITNIFSFLLGGQIAANGNALGFSFQKCLCDNLAIDTGRPCGPGESSSGKFREILFW